MPAKKKVTNVSKLSKKMSQELSAYAQTERDFKDAVLLVSIFANLFILCLWAALQTTNMYDAALADFFINR